MPEETRVSVEPQYQHSFDEHQRLGPVELGPMSSLTWRADPRRLTFLLARYKFVSKMLAGKDRVLEIGCGDGFGMRVVLQTVGSAHGIDFDPTFLEWAERIAAKEDLNADFSKVDFTLGTTAEKFDAAYSLDVIEHIEPAQEHLFMANIAAALKPGGVCIIGTPNVTSAAYASVASQIGHINLKSGETLTQSMKACYEHVFVFSMNDEVLHTGFYPMAHYLIAMGVNPRPAVARG